MKKAKKIVALVPKMARAETIKILEDVLREAKDGDVVAVAIASVTSWGAGRTVVSPSDNVLTLAGTVARLQHRLQAELG